MRNIRLRQIKIITPKGKSLTEKQVKTEVRRANQLLDTISGVFNTPKSKRSKVVRSNGKDAQ